MGALHFYLFPRKSIWGCINFFYYIIKTSHGCLAMDSITETARTHSLYPSQLGSNCGKMFLLHGCWSQRLFIHCLLGHLSCSSFSIIIAISSSGIYFTAKFPTGFPISRPPFGIGVKWFFPACWFYHVSAASETTTTSRVELARFQVPADIRPTQFCPPLSLKTSHVRYSTGHFSHNPINRHCTLYLHSYRPLCSEGPSHSRTFPTYTSCLFHKTLTTPSFMVLFYQLFWMHNCEKSLLTLKFRADLGGQNRVACKLFSLCWLQTLYEKLWW